MQKTIKLSLFAGVSLFALALVSPMMASAIDSPTPTTTNEKVQPRTNERKETAVENSEERKEGQQEKKAATAKLEEKKLQACQKREQKINDMMTKMSERGTKQLAVFNKISDRTQDFYTEKARTVSNYDALLADLTTKNAAAEAAIASTKDSSVAFKCDGTDPKGASASFKQSLQAQKQALKDYKTSVKNLIQAVKSAQSTSTDNSGTSTTEGTQQ